jgi:hypothetical protein
MGCLLASGYASSCQTKKQKNGLQGSVYLFNLENSSGVKLGFTEDVNGNVSDITLATGDQGYKLAGSKLMHTYSADLSVPTRGNQFYMQNLTLKVIEKLDTDLTFVLELVAAEGMVAVIETYNQEFIVLGQQNGLSSIEGTMFTYDTDTTADVGTSIALQSDEDYHKKYFFDTDYATTKAKLESYLTPAA